MKTTTLRLALAGLLCLGLVAPSPTYAAYGNHVYGKVVSATSANTVVSFGSKVNTIQVMNEGSAKVYIAFDAVAVATAGAYAPIPSCQGVTYLFEGDGPTTMGVITASSTATVDVVGYFRTGGGSPGPGAPATSFALGSCATPTWSTVTVTGLTSGRVVLASTGGLLADDSDLTFATATLSATNLTVATALTNTALTSGRVPIASTGGLFADDSDLTFSTDTLTATKIVVTTGTASTLPTASVDRADMIEDALAAVGTVDLKQVTGIDLAATETAGTFNLAIGTNLINLRGEVTDNETETSVGYFWLVLPGNYVAAGDVTFRFRSALIASASPTDNGSTLDLSCYEQADGAVGADIVSTGAATYAALDTYYSKDFALTATSLVAGDTLLCKVTTAIVDSEAGGGTITWTSDPIKVLADVKG